MFPNFIIEWTEIKRNNKKIIIKKCIMDRLNNYNPDSLPSSSNLEQ